MPTAVPKVEWHCARCRTHRLLLPSVAKIKRYCSRSCKYAAQTVTKPVRAIRGRVLVRYGERACNICAALYLAKTPAQMFCSQDCATVAMHRKRRGASISSRPCEYCSKAFTPRKGSAGRFCSFNCKNKGQKGPAASGWKGGRIVSAAGYVQVSENGEYVLEHRSVMAKHLGRKLEPYETVHHIDGNRANNVIENLQLRTGRHGKGAAHQCADCGSRNIVSVPIADRHQ